jgi:hypothetical protein
VRKSCGVIAAKASVQILSGDLVISISRGSQETKNSAPGCAAAKKVLGYFGLSRGRGGERGADLRPKGQKKTEAQANEPGADT